MTSRELAEIYARRQPPSQPRAKRGTGRVGRAKREACARSVLESRFADLWRTLGGPELVEQHQFCPGRSFRFDFAHLPTRIAIELQGGIWSQGRHSRGSGVVKEAEKQRLAVSLGWRYYPLTTDDVSAHEVEKLIALVKGETKGERT